MGDSFSLNATISPHTIQGWHEENRPKSLIPAGTIVNARFLFEFDDAHRTRL
jgi:hypothetical protein